MTAVQQNSTKSTTRITTAQVAVIEALVQGGSVTDATKKANVDRTTFYVWMKTDAKFVAELNRAKQEKIDSMHAQLRELAVIAMATLKQMLTGTNVSPAVQLRAALAVLAATGALEPEPIGETNRDKIEFDQFMEMMH